MKKYFVSFFLIVAFAFYLLLNNKNSTDVGPSANGPVAANMNTGNSTAGTALTPASAPGTAGGAYRNGAYAGSVADAYFGKVQVEAIIQGGQLSNVQIMQSPNDNGHSKQVSDSSLPQLVQEAIQAQNANVNIVSGATQTSQAFQQSLAAALAQAKI